MATKKVSKKAAAKSNKAAAKSNNDTRKIIGVAGQDEHFYTKFPRYAAYQLLCNAPKRTMLVKTFLAKVAKLDGVNTPAQANGILQKLVDKKRHVGSVCAKLA